MRGVEWVKDEEQADGNFVFMWPDVIFKLLPFFLNVEFALNKFEGMRNSLGNLFEEPHLVIINMINCYYWLSGVNIYSINAIIRI